jgi:hypothetical protein
MSKLDATIWGLAAGYCDDSEKLSSFSTHHLLKKDCGLCAEVGIPVAELGTFENMRNSSTAKRYVKPRFR